MASNKVFDTSELDDLVKDMYRVAQEKYPTEVKKFLREEGNEARRRLRAATKSTTTKHTGNLLKGIKRSKVTKYNGDYQIRVFNSAYHAHLLEYGHVFYHRGNKTEKFVPGKHMFDQVTNQMNSRFGNDVEDFVDKLLSEGFGL